MVTEFKQLSLEELKAGADEMDESPKDSGALEMIVRRPDTGEREVMERAELSVDQGVVGDNWQTRGSSRTDDGSSHPDMQIAAMNSRMIDLIAQDRSRWHLAGDQMFIDIDLSEENLPIGQQIAIGTAVLEVTEQPHTGCRKFAERYGRDATRFVNAQGTDHLRRRGVNLRVVQAGTVSQGDAVTKI